MHIRMSRSYSIWGYTIDKNATQYHFRVRSFSGDQMELALHGPGSAAPRQPPIVSQWAESARKILGSAFHWVSHLLGQGDADAGQAARVTNPVSLKEDLPEIRP